MTTIFRPFPRRMSETFRVVGLFPAPVLTAHMDINGFCDSSMVVLGPMRRKSAPHARTSEALFITVTWERSV